MSRLEYDGHSHSIALISASFVVGSWDAFNNVDSHYAAKHGLTHLKDGVYVIRDKNGPSPKTKDAQGPYGSYGIFHFDVKGHPGIGVHSGRALPPWRIVGPSHATHGCIRTTDDAIKAISEWAAKDPLTTITVKNNSPLKLRSAKARNMLLRP